MLGFGRFFGLHLDPRNPSPPTPGWIERPCIGCLDPVRKYGREMRIEEQFCSARCSRAFHRGYDTGINVLTDHFTRYKKQDEGAWWNQGKGQRKRAR